MAGHYNDNDFYHSYRHWKCFCQFVDEEHLAERMSKTRWLFNCAMTSAYNTFYTLYCKPFIQDPDPPLMSVLVYTLL